MPLVRSTVNTYKREDGTKFRAILFHALGPDAPLYRKRFVCYLHWKPKDLINFAFGEPRMGNPSLTVINKAEKIDSVNIKDWYVTALSLFVVETQIDLIGLNSNPYTDETDWVEKWMDPMVAKGELDPQFAFNIKLRLLAVMRDLPL